ncbi:MAG: HEAT repeat domain-containing protein [Burkholderiales bacterium]|nr:HEAT repeat domain-containing protein [Burkholderiales bacterium]
MSTAQALLFISGHCPHCPSVLTSLTEMIKSGTLSELRVVNIEQSPNVAHQHGVRSVPWVQIGPIVLTGLRSRQELEQWARRVGDESALAEWIHIQLKEGALDEVLDHIRRTPQWLAAVLPIVANPDASLNVRIGAGAILEAFAGTPALSDLIPQLIELSRHEDARVRADACHYLGLTRDARARTALEAALQDTDADVREIAAESLAGLAPAGGREATTA